jgi:hypothetical protein
VFRNIMIIWVGLLIFGAGVVLVNTDLMTSPPERKLNQCRQMDTEGITGKTKQMKCIAEFFDQCTRTLKETHTKPAVCTRFLEDGWSELTAKWKL